MSTSFNSGLHKTLAGLYWLLGSAAAVLALQVYMAGYYQAILLPTLFAPIFFALGVWRWQAPSKSKQDPAAVVALLAVAVFILLQPTTSLPANFDNAWLALGYPLLAFYLLSSYWAAPLSLLLLSLVVVFQLGTLDWLNLLVFCGHYCLLLLLAWIYLLQNQIKTRLLVDLFGLDKTTGFFNRSYLEQHLTAEVSRARAMHKPLTVLMVELHQYQEIRQEFGLRQAEKFIAEVGASCQVNRRVGDSAYRYDAQTLVLLNPNTSMNGALVMRTRLYQHLLQEIICDAGPLDVSITPITLKEGEKLEELQQRIAESSYHSLSERMQDNLFTPPAN